MKLVKQTVGDVAVGYAGTEGARRASGVPPSPATPETEVLAKAERRRFSAEYKRRIVGEADRGTRVGAIGAMVRR